MIKILIFLFGLAIGSFLNSVIYRLEMGLSFLWGRSFCPNCQHDLGFWELIPLISFIFLKGRCRYCFQKISWQYPLVELSVALLFLFIFLFFSPNYYKVFYLFTLTCFLIVIFVFDLKHYIIPDEVIYPAIGISFFYHFFEILKFPISSFQFSVFKNLSNPLFSAFLASLSFFLLILFSRGQWMGMGDLKFSFLMGLFLGFPNILVALFLSFFLGAIIGIGLILAGKKNLKSQVPFGPFLVTGTFIALFCGDQVISWYFKFLNLSI